MEDNEKPKSVFYGLMDMLRGKKNPAESLTKGREVISGSSPDRNNDPNNIQQKQQQYLDFQSTQIAKDIYARTQYFDTDRISAYNDYNAMDKSPEVAAALDIISSECCQRNERGHIISIYSDNLRIKKILQELFQKTLNAESNISFWARELCKNGDVILKLDVDQKEGIYDCILLPLEQVHKEMGFDGNPQSSRYKWDVGNMYLEDFQVAHFRLLYDASRLPYGRSILDPARKLWRQLQLAEDAMLTYRIIRAPERRIFYIQMGNTNPNDYPQLMEQVKRSIKKTSIVDSTGQINLKFNPLPVWSKTPIPLLDNRTITIEELAKEFEEGKENYVYSVQDKTNKIVPGKVIWCGKNYTANSLIKTWLDDNTWILTAPEHPFVLRDGSSKRADELVSGDSLMPYYRNKTNRRDFSQIFNPETGTFEFVNKLIPNELLQINELEESLIVDVEAVIYQNHKVLKTEVVNSDSGEDVFCMTVVGLNDEHDRHNFACLSFNEDNSISKSGVFVKNTYEEDFFLPLVGDKSSKIDTLPGANNLSDIADIEYLQNKLFAALQVPKPYLNYAESLAGGSTLSQIDVRFGKMICRIQEQMINEFRRLANIHLYMLGFQDDLDNFVISLTNPSIQQELMNLELWKAKLEVFKELYSSEVTSPVSYSFAMERVLGLSKSEIRQILEQKKVERKMFSEIERSVDEYMDTGIFKNIDSKFRRTGFDPAKPITDAGDGSGGGDEGGGGGFGGSSMLGGGGMDDLSGGDPSSMGDDLGGDVGGDSGGVDNSMPTDMSAEPSTETEPAETEQSDDEEIPNLKENKLLTENRKFNIQTKKLMKGINESLAKLKKETKDDDDDEIELES